MIEWCAVSARTCACACIASAIRADVLAILNLGSLSQSCFGLVKDGVYQSFAHTCDIANEQPPIDAPIQHVAGGIVMLQQRFAHPDAVQDEAEWCSRHACGWLLLNPVEGDAATVLHGTDLNERGFSTSRRSTVLAPTPCTDEPDLQLRESYSASASHIRPLCWKS
jgi:hypothetical protein